MVKGSQLLYDGLPVHSLGEGELCFAVQSASILLGLCVRLFYYIAIVSNSYWIDFKTRTHFLLRILRATSAA